MKKIVSEEEYIIDNEKLAKSELKRHFNGISVVTDEMINNNVSKAIDLMANEKKLIDSITSYLKMFNQKNNQFTIIKNTNKQINLIFKFIEDNTDYKYLELLLNMITTLKLILKKIDNNIIDFNNEIEKLYSNNSEIVNHNVIAPYLYYIENSQNNIYKFISKQINLEGEENPTTLIELLSDSYALKICKTAVSICFNEKEYDNNLSEEILEETIIDYTGDESINYKIASLTKAKYYEMYGTKEQIEKREPVIEDNYTEISIHEYYGQQMNIIDLIKSKDEKYNLFLILKYGLSADQCFYSLEAIHLKTGMSMEKIKTYYSDSLKFIKNYQEKFDNKEKVM